MNGVLLLLLHLCLTLPMMPAPQGQGWHSIVPLHSTRADVERLIGKPNFEYGLYDFDNERVDIIYTSNDGCGASQEDGWRVPKDTVLSISVSLKEMKPLSQLSIDREKYEKTEGGDVEGIVYYSNKDEGITYEVRYNKVTAIMYGPTTKDEYLRCSIPAVRGVCPHSLIAYVDCPTEAIKSGTPIKFAATVGGGDPRNQPTYKWTVSAGTIISGQGTFVVSIDTAGLSSQSITATVEVSGLSTGCIKVASCTAQISSHKNNKLRRNHTCNYPNRLGAGGAGQRGGRGVLHGLHGGGLRAGLPAAGHGRRRAVPEQ